MTHRIGRDEAAFAMLDGEPRDPAAPGLGAAWPGVLRGESVFEAFRYEDGSPTPFLDRHADRLAASAERCGFALPAGGMLADWPRFRALLPEVGAWRVRFTLLRRDDDGVARLWTAGSATPPPESVTVAVSEHRLDPGDPLAGAKTGSRILHQVARRRAQAQGADEALLRTVDGDLAEGTSTSLFVVRDGVVATPPLDRGILPGVTRGVVLEACREAGIPVRERRVEPAELAEIAELWLTSAVIGVVPATRVVGLRDDLPGRDGALLEPVRAAWRRRLAAARAAPSATP